MPGCFEKQTGAVGELRIVIDNQNPRFVGPSLPDFAGVHQLILRS
jgi:hypothetical protein